LSASRDLSDVASRTSNRRCPEGQKPTVPYAGRAVSGSKWEAEYFHVDRWTIGARAFAGHVRRHRFPFGVGKCKNRMRCTVICTATIFLFERHRGKTASATCSLQPATSNHQACSKPPAHPPTLPVLSCLALGYPEARFAGKDPDLRKASSQQEGGVISSSVPERPCPAGSTTAASPPSRTLTSAFAARPAHTNKNGRSETTEGSRCCRHHHICCHAGIVAAVPAKWA
jgi:hypothetical protein